MTAKLTVNQLIHLVSRPGILLQTVDIDNDIPYTLVTDRALKRIWINGTAMDEHDQNMEIDDVDTIELLDTGVIHVVTTTGTRREEFHFPVQLTADHEHIREMLKPPAPPHLPKELNDTTFALTTAATSTIMDEINGCMDFRLLLKTLYLAEKTMLKTIPAATTLMNELGSCVDIPPWMELLVLPKILNYNEANLPITGDCLVSTDIGPVPGMTLRMINGLGKPEYQEKWNGIFQKENHILRQKTKVDTKILDPVEKSILQYHARREILKGISPKTPDELFALEENPAESAS
jgi:hypothetical protein